MDKFGEMWKNIFIAENEKWKILEKSGKNIKFCKKFEKQTNLDKF